jgi:hypothetical protein
MRRHDRKYKPKGATHAKISRRIPETIRMFPAQNQYGISVKYLNLINIKYDELITNMTDIFTLLQYIVCSCWSSFFFWCFLHDVKNSKNIILTPINVMAMDFVLSRLALFT